MKNIVYKNKIYLLFLLTLFLSINVFAQEVEVKGKVISLSSHEGFAGARVSVVNTRLTSMSGENGEFEIKVPATDVTLRIDAPGFQPQIVALRGETYVEIKMLSQTGAAYFYDDTEFSTTGVVSISDFSENILSIDEDLTARLSGQVRAITHSGTQGSGSAVFARGLNSLNASSQPLYVVDGVIWQVQEQRSVNNGFYNNPLAVIAPKDVEKITVLKSGSSIYGSKGANGVILIDTKRARSQATHITVDLGVGYRSRFSTIPVMGADDYLLYVSDIIGEKYSNTSLVEKYKFLENDPTKSYYKANHNNTDWLKLINKGGMTQNYGISVQGGDDVALYGVSVGYAHGDGNVKNTSFERLNFRLNSDIYMTQRLKVAFDIAFTQTDNQLRNDGIDRISSPVYLSLIKSPLYNPYEFDINGNLSKRLSNYDELEVGNPLALIENGVGKSKNYALNTSILPTYTFGDDKVKVGALFSYGWRKLNEGSFIPDNGIPETPLYNDLGEIYAVSRNVVKDRVDTHTSIIAEARVDWNILKDGINQLSAFGGYRFYSDGYKSHYAMGYNTGSDNVRQLTNTQESLRTSEGLDENWKSMSWYANVDYSFNNKYLVTASAAMDASSRFGDDIDGSLSLGGLSWGLFPSISGAWIISSENFMKDVTFLDFLKLTAGYSMSGNDGVPNYASKTYFSSIVYDDSWNGIVLGNIGNSEMKWEMTHMASVGLDFSMFNNIWNVKTEFYTSKTKDLLTQKSLNDIAGLKYFWSNDGELQNNGFEISTNVRVLNNRDLKLDFGASIGHYKNKITSLANGTFVTEVCGAQIITQENKPAGLFYGYKTNGVFSTRQDAERANLSIVTNTGQRIPFQAGDMYFAEVEVDGVIDEKDMQVIGDPNPDLYGNFHFNVSWKRFTMEALFTYSYGNDVYNALRANLEAGLNTDNQSKAMRNRWVASGQVTDIPRATYDDPMGNARFSDRWIEDGSYLRFKTLSLSYKMPVQSTYLQGITVWGAVNNIFTITKYLGADPEFAYGNSVLYQGVDAGLIPQSRAFNVGVKINL